MNLCELSEGMVPTNKLSETHVRCVVQIKERTLKMGQPIGRRLLKGGYV